MRKQLFDISFSALVLARSLCAAVFLALCFMLLAPCFPAAAQQPAGIPRIEIVVPASASSFSAWVEAFRQRLRELGYVEGKTFLLSTDMQKGNANGCLTLQPNWSVSKLTSSSPPVRLL